MSQPAARKLNKWLKQNRSSTPRNKIAKHELNCDPALLRRVLKGARPSPWFAQQIEKLTGGEIPWTSWFNGKAYKKRAA